MCDDATHSDDGQPGGFSFEEPEGGCFWHAMNADGLAAWENHQAVFGLVHLPPLASNAALFNAPYVRCRPSRAAVAPWVSPGGAVLAIPACDLDADDWVVPPEQQDAFVRGQAARTVGTIVEFT